MDIVGLVTTVDPAHNPAAMLLSCGDATLAHAYGAYKDLMPKLCRPGTAIRTRGPCSTSLCGASSAARPA
eukprot:353116-Chlamydomonas_euryale.AAC.2